MSVGVLFFNLLILDLERRVFLTIQWVDKGMCPTCLSMG